MSATQLRRRPSRGVPATLVALIVLAVSVLATTAAVTRLASSDWPSWATGPARAVAQQSWGATPVIAAAVVGVVLGVVLLLAALVPGRRSGVPVDLSVTNAEVSEVVITQRGVARLAAAAADEVDGVESVDVSVSTRLVRVEVVTASRSDVESVRSAVQASVEDRLDVLGSGPVCEVRTRVRSRES
ncbi:DUF6286 domain-containing protein [Serinibacter arcticus]|uniref:DUF6286 domain-containing protein n=1 Tax=Serinibacter arcticus TaxID=1655435 RepID=A0A4Z1E400_9MICO|nr:DUF6286 domain-containing protein [Serinibacter arcticus]TGO05648.1 hypothetical protein SERN_1652 [Serinibacter arcticus]